MYMCILDDLCMCVCMYVFMYVRMYEELMCIKYFV